MSIFKVNDLFYNCSTKNTRSGFAHLVQVENRFGEVLAVAKINYYNRTWEKYNYQSVMIKGQEAIKKQIKKAIKGQVFINYRYEDFTEYNFDQEPPRATYA